MCLSAVLQPKICRRRPERSGGRLRALGLLQGSRKEPVGAPGVRGSGAGAALWAQRSAALRARGAGGGVSQPLFHGNHWTAGLLQTPCLSLWKPWRWERMSVRRKARGVPRGWDRRGDAAGAQDSRCQGQAEGEARKGEVRNWPFEAAFLVCFFKFPLPLLYREM